MKNMQLGKGYAVKKLAISFIALCVVGCSGQSSDTDGDGKVSESEFAAEMKKVPLTPGLWENSIEYVDVQLKGNPEDMPDGITKRILNKIKGSRKTRQICLTDEMARNPGADFFAVREKGNCEIAEFKLDGGNVTAQMSCKNESGPGRVDIQLTGKYGSSDYDMNMATTSMAYGSSFELKARNVGKRVGECPPEGSVETPQDADGDSATPDQPDQEPAQ